MANTKKITVNKVIKALIKNNGYISFAAREIGCHRNTITNMMKSHPEIREIVDDKIELKLDIAEIQIENAIKSGDLSTAKWYLDRIGKKRGYGITTIQQDSESEIPQIPISKDTQKLGIEYLRNLHNEPNNG